MQFRDQVGPLHDAGITTVAFDAFGCGSSPKPREPAAYAPGELYADLEATYERFGKVRQVSSLAVPAPLCTTSLSCSYALLRHRFGAAFLWGRCFGNRTGFSRALTGRVCLHSRTGRYLLSHTALGRAWRFGWRQRLGAR